MNAVILIGTPLLALLVITMVAGWHFHRSRFQRRMALLQLSISRLQTDLNQFIIDKRPELSPTDLRIADELLSLKGNSVARTRRLFRSYHRENKASNIIGITRYAVDRVEPVMNYITHPELLHFYRRYQQILLEGFESHLPGSPFAQWIPLKWRIALLLKSTRNRQLQGLNQWYSRRAEELHA